MHLKKHSVEEWQDEKHYSKDNNTSENTIPRRENFKPVHLVKYEGQVRSQYLLFVQFLVELSSCLAAYENCYKPLFSLTYAEVSGWI